MKTPLRPLLAGVVLAALLPLARPFAAEPATPTPTASTAPAAATSAATPTTPAPATAVTSTSDAVPAAPAATAATTTSASVSTPTSTSDSAATPATQGTDSTAPSAPSAAAAPAPAAAPAAPAATATTSGELRRLDEPATAPAAPAAENAPAPASAPTSDEHTDHQRQRGGSADPIVNIGGDSFLPKGQLAEAVVAVGGNATAEGDVNQAVVAIAGDARATGHVGDAVVAVLGNVYVDSEVNKAVAVFGNIELGPHAVVNGDVVSVGGELHRDAKAVIHGNVPHVQFGHLGHFTSGLQAFMSQCVFKARLLAFGPHLGWIWAIALGFLVFYILLALLFPHAIERCAVTFETRPWRSLLAAFLSLLLIPIAFLLLCATVVGIPFAIVGLTVLSLFGKAVMLAWIGRRITRFFGEGPLAHPAVAVLIGGIIVMGLYLVPFLALLVNKLLGALGLGVVVYTMILSSKRNKPPRAAAAGAVPPVVPVTVAGEAAGANFATGPAMSAGFAGDAAAGAATATATPVAEVPLTPPIALTTLPRAGFWIRIAALLIDLILVAVVLAFVPSLVRPHSSGLMLALAVYGAILWKTKGTTVGGIICGLRVVRLDGREIDWATACIRALGCMLSTVVVGLGFIWIAIDDDKQAWHDKIAGTVVVLAPRNASLV